MTNACIDRGPLLGPGKHIRPETDQASDYFTALWKHPQFIKFTTRAILLNIYSNDLQA